MFVSSLCLKEKNFPPIFRLLELLLEETVETYSQGVMIGRNIAQSFSHLCRIVLQCLS